MFIKKIILASLMIFLCGCTNVKLGSIGSNDFLSNDDGSIICQYSPFENLLICLNKFEQEINSFSCHSYGEINTIGYVQKVDTIRQKRNTNEILFQNISTSALVKIAEQVYFKNDNCYRREAIDVENLSWSENYEKYSTQDFIDKYAWHPTQFTHFIINKNSVISGEFINTTNNKYTFSYIFDNILATPNYQIKMKEMGNLSDYPVFSKIKYELTIDENWNPIQVKTIENYQIKKGILTLNATANIIEDFTLLNQNVELQDYAFFQNVK